MTNGDKRQPKRIDIYEEYILWSAMPPTERMKLGIETQEQFVEFYKIGINTPTAWKRRPDFEGRVTAMRREWAFGKTSAVIEGIYRAALKGNPHSQKLWLQYFHNFTEKQEISVKPHRAVSINDVMFLIEALPEELRNKHYEWVREFLLHASLAYQKAKEDGDLSMWNAPVPADWKPRYRIVDSEGEMEESDEERTDRVIRDLKNIIPEPMLKDKPGSSYDCCDPFIDTNHNAGQYITKVFKYKLNGVAQAV